MSFFSKSSQTDGDTEFTPKRGAEWVPPFIQTIRTLFLFLKDFSFDIKEIDSQKFKEDIDKLSNQFISEEKINKIESVFEKQKIAISDYIQRQKDYIGDREKEFRDIIELLNKAMTGFDDRNKEFYHRVYDQSEKIEQITKLEDIKKIKLALKQEIENIRHLVDDKKSEDKKELYNLSSRVETLKQELEQAKKKSETDGLTGINNRQAFDDYIQDAVERNTLMKAPFSMLLLDIDDFKKINDTHGHVIGDRVLVAFATKCKTFIRSNDFIARYGGEEFAIILPGASIRNATKKGKQICKAISETQYAVGTGQSGELLSITVSIGISRHKKGEPVSDVIDRADKALYKAKKTGKNRAVNENKI